MVYKEVMDKSFTTFTHRLLLGEITESEASDHDARTGSDALDTSLVQAVVEFGRTPCILPGAEAVRPISRK